MDIRITKGETHYIANCIDIPGCLTQGETIPEAVKNIAEAIELCIEVRKEKWGIE